MTTTRSVVKDALIKGSLLLGIVGFASGCVVTTPREGYWDRDHNRWYHDHAWVDCGDHDEHCR